MRPLITATLMLAPLLASLPSGPAMAQQAKQIGMRPRAAAAPLVLEVKADKPEYKVNEAIKVKARVNRPAYVYVFVPDAKGNQVILLYPEKATDRNLLPRGQWVSLPPAREFFSDAPGRERIFFVASPKPIDMSARYFIDAGFGRAPGAELTKAFAEKGIRVRPRDTDAAAVRDPNQKLLVLRIAP